MLTTYDCDNALFQHVYLHAQRALIPLTHIKEKGKKVGRGIGLWKRLTGSLEDGRRHSGWPEKEKEGRRVRGKQM